MQKQTVLGAYFRVLDVGKTELMRCLERIKLPEEELEKVRVVLLLDDMMLQSKIYTFVEEHNKEIEAGERKALVELLAPNLHSYVAQVSESEWDRGFLFAKTLLSLLRDLKPVKNEQSS